MCPNALWVVMCCVFHVRNESDEEGNSEKKKFKNQLSGKRYINVYQVQFTSNKIKVACNSIQPQRYRCHCDGKAKH